MKRLFMSVFLMLTLFACFAACSTDNPEPEQLFPPETPDHENGSGSDTPENDNEQIDSMRNQLKITIGNVSFDVIPENNAAVKALKELLPMTVSMSELNGNEKYFYLSRELPVAPFRPGTVYAGDLMLYGSSCIVLFYETFSTSYSYTRLGRIENPSGLVSALGRGSITITFEFQ